jgi:hypothetical protein
MPDLDQNDPRWGNNWGDLFTLRDAAHGAGEDFGINFWAGGLGGGSTNSAGWYNLFYQFTGAERTYGPTPDLFTVDAQNHNVPHPTVPETSAYSFMWDVYEMIAFGWYPGSPVGGGSDYTTIAGGSILNPEQSWSSPNGRFVLKYQNDGNLVLYDNGGAVWAINCWPDCNSTGFQGNAFQPAGYLTMQTDGNLVVYNSSAAPVWHASTFGNPGAYLTIWDDGSLFVYRSDGDLLWQR